MKRQTRIVIIDPDSDWASRKAGFIRELLPQFRIEIYKKASDFIYVNSKAFEDVALFILNIQIKDSEELRRKIIVGEFKREIILIGNHQYWIDDKTKVYDKFNLDLLKTIEELLIPVLPKV